MQALKFRLKGKHAFFKIPAVNSYYYFTYAQIHKVALLGIFGAILGYDGYQQMQKEDRFPEFYERLQALKVSVIPCVKNGIFLKKVQTFNNSIGSLEQGGNLIVQEQWLEKPEWLIYVLLDCEESEKLAEMLEKSRAFIFLIWEKMIILLTFWRLKEWKWKQQILQVSGSTAYFRRRVF